MQKNITAAEKRAYRENATNISDIIFQEACEKSVLRRALKSIFPGKGLHFDYSNVCKAMGEHFTVNNKPVYVIHFLKEKLGEPTFQVRLSFFTAVWVEEHIIVTGSKRGIGVYMPNTSSRAQHQQAWAHFVLATTGKPSTWT